MLRVIEGDLGPQPSQDPRNTHVVWLLRYDIDLKRVAWDTDGIVLTERTASADVCKLKVVGMTAIALPVGKEPEQLHPANRPAKVIG